MELIWGVPTGSGHTTRLEATGSMLAAAGSAAGLPAATTPAATTMTAALPATAANRVRALMPRRPSA